MVRFTQRVQPGLVGTVLDEWPVDLGRRSGIGCAARLLSYRRGGLMPRSRNRLDGRQVYFEDESGDGVPVVFHGGFLDSVADVRESNIAQAVPAGEFRRIYVDHRGLGASDKPHDPAAYAMEVRVGDAVGVLDELSIERAHFVGMSWGGRLGFGIGEHALERVLSLIIGGQQPYEWPDSPITRAVSHGLAAARAKGAEGVVEALEAFWKIRFPDERRARWVANDAAALKAAWTTALSEGPVAHDLRAAGSLPHLHGSGR